MRYVEPLSMFKDLLKTPVRKRGRLLGLDVGDKYVGLAVSDRNNKIASPVSVLLRTKTNIDLMTTDFLSLISEYKLVGLVVGCPSNRSENAAEAVPVKLFIDELSKSKKLEGVAYTYWDENFTSKGVGMLLKPLNFHPYISKTITDKYAAVGILQGYLDYVNKKMKVESLE